MIRNFQMFAEPGTDSHPVAADAGMGARHAPPLRQLHCFTAAARYLNYERAAADFNITGQAVGQQVRSLEDQLGCRLFDRARGILELTPAGRALYLELAPAFERIAYAFAVHGRAPHPKQVTVATTSAFAALWLVPRLRTFRQAHPDLELRVLATTTPLGKLDVEADCAIIQSGEVPSGLIAEPFMTEAVLPVQAPARLCGQHGIPLLHDDSPDRDPELNNWTAWRETIGGPQFSSGLRFDDPLMGLAAAEAGLGVWLARARLVAEPLAAGRLIRPFGVARRSACAWRVALPPAAAARAAVVAFRHWLEAQAAAAPALPV